MKRPRMLHLCCDELLRRLFLCLLTVVFIINAGKGQTWTPTGYGAFGGYVSQMTVAGGNIIVGSSFDGIKISSNNGASWKQSNSGLGNLKVNGLISSGSIVLAGTISGVYASSDYGASWSATTLTTFIQTMGTSNGIHYAGTFSGLYKSADNGATWTKTLSVGISSFTTYGSMIIVSDESAIYTSADNGVTWVKSYTFTNAYVYTLAASSKAILAQTNGGLFRSTDGGTTWSLVSSSYMYDINVTSNNGNFYLFGGGDLLRSHDDGTTFAQVVTSISLLAASGSTLYALGSTLFTSVDDGLSWQQQNTGPGVLSSPIGVLVPKGSTILASTPGGISRSFDGGNSWAFVTSTTQPKGVNTIKRLGTNLYASSNGFGVYVSADEGATWAIANVGLTNLGVTCMEVVGNSVFAGTTTGIFVSHDQGATWSATSVNGIPILTMTTDGVTLYAAKNSNEILTSSDNGATWTIITAIPNSSVDAMVFFRNQLVISNWKGIYVTSDGGKSWSSGNFGVPAGASLTNTTNGKWLIFYGNADTRATVYASTGSSARDITPFYYESLYSFAFKGDTLYGVFNYNNIGSLWLTNLSTGIDITSVSPTSGKVGSVINITGYNFNPVASKNLVSINGVYCTVLNATSTSMQIVVPETYGSSPIKIQTSGNTVTSSISFSVVPEITGFTPSSGIVGTAVTVYGHGFNQNVFSGVMYFNSQASQSYPQNSTTYSTTVPDFATSGLLSIIDNGTTYYSPTAFKILPQISSFYPTEGVAGTEVSINGTGFDPVKSNDTVTFNGVVAKVVSSYSHNLVVLVPTGAKSGEITVNVSGNAALSLTPFIVDGHKKPCYSYPPKPSIKIDQASSGFFQQVLISSSAGGNHWFKDNVPIPEASDTVYIATEVGSYTVQVNVQGCASPMSDPEIFAVTEISKTDLLVVYPNPTHGLLTLNAQSFATQLPVTVEVINSVGKTVMKSFALDGSTSSPIDISDCAAGIYFVRLSQGNLVLIQKVAKY